MTYQETLDYIFQKLPMFSRMGSAAFKKDLTNIRTLCARLGNPQEAFKTIHVAGTNGKGSVSHMLAAVFQKAGYKTGLYTSPHLYDFRERIRVDGDMVPETYVTGFIAGLQSLIEEIEPSFFEITVAMAFSLFREQKVDIAIIEVGLGGRLDSTNIIRPELSVITNIGWDHMNLLGDSLEKIAFEKAGIIKKNIPVVIGETLPETKSVFREVANKREATIHWAEALFSVENSYLHPNSIVADLKKNDGTRLLVETDLAGIYQVQNIRTVLAAVAVLKEAGWQLPEACVFAALREVKALTGLGGRWEVIGQAPTVVLEVAHNPHGISRMMEHVRLLSFERLHLVIGVVKDKEVEKVLELLPPEASYYFTQANIPRALPAAELQQIAASLHLAGASFENVNLALRAAMQKAGKDDLVIICGSIFLVAEVDKTQYDISPRRANA